MKKIYENLQRYVLVIAILFRASPRFLNIVATEYGRPYVTIYCWVLALSGSAIFLLFLWYLKAKWNLKHRGYMTAVGFAGLVGVLVGWSALAFLYRILDIEFQKTIAQASFFAMTGIL